MAITTYSSIFNVSPKFEIPELLVFDDAHSGEQYVAGAYSLEITRAFDEDSYGRVLGVLASALDGLYVQRLRNDVPDLTARRQVHLFFPRKTIYAATSR